MKFPQGGRMANLQTKCAHFTSQENSDIRRSMRRGLNRADGIDPLKKPDRHFSSADWPQCAPTDQPGRTWYRDELYLHEPAQCHQCHPALERQGEATTRTLKL